VTTALEKTLKRELSIDGQAYTVTLSPEGLTVTLKGRRKGVQLEWRALVSGEAALATALNASLGQLAGASAAAAPPAAPERRTSSRRASKGKHAPVSIQSPSASRRRDRRR
jgi:hypothetical protein